MPSLSHICVCICTYKRPQRLRSLLQELEKQETGGLFRISIVVVDNDAAESARPVVSALQASAPLRLRYFVEPRQNISLARNKSIENAEGDYIALIDDDELPGPGWLWNLYGAIQAFDAAGILGPVLPRFEKAPPRWIEKGRLFDRPRHPSGHVLNWANTRTGNALLKKSLFESGVEWFRPEFGSGGEDRDFFKRMIAKGYAFKWCDEAPVHEIVPPERWRTIILVKRALLRGQMALRSSASLSTSVLTSLMAVVIYALALPLLFILSPVIGYDIFFQYLIKEFDHLGRMAAFFKIDLVKSKYVG